MNIATRARFDSLSFTISREEFELKLAQRAYSFWTEKEAEAREKVRKTGKNPKIDHDFIRFYRQRRKKAKSDMDWHQKRLDDAKAAKGRAEVMA